MKPQQTVFNSLINWHIKWMVNYSMETTR